MKKNILLQFFAFILLFSSCDELLLEDPEFTFNEQTLFSTPESAQLALNACYGYLSGTGMYGQVLNIQAEGCTGISWGRKAPGHRNFEYASLNVLPTNLILRLFWNGSYKTISECNIFIDIVEKSTLDNREHLVAQAKFLRALTYYNLAFMHGGVPLKIAPPTAETTNVGKSTQLQVINQVVEDLEFGVVNLNLTEDSAAIPTQVTANAMLAKIYFLLGSREGDGSPHWLTAKSYGDKVFTAVGSQPPLESDMRVLFDENTRRTTESLFTLTYAVDNIGNSYNRNSWVSAPLFSTTNGINFSSQMSVSRPFYNYFNKQHPGDPRIDATFFHNSYIYGRGNRAGTSNNIYPTIRMGREARVFTKKYFDSNQIGSESARTLIVYRYADFLLLMADVENELGNKSLAINYVNQVLTRARQSADVTSIEPQNLDAGISTTDLRQFIFDERLFELNNEGHTFMEVRRRGLEFWKPIMQRHNLDPDVVAEIDLPTPWWRAHAIAEDDTSLQRALLMPIPQAELDSNLGLSSIDQNPGY